jgi:hypothetical protein
MFPGQSTIFQLYKSCLKSVLPPPRRTRKIIQRRNLPAVEGGRPRPPPRIGRRTQSRGHRRRPRPSGTTPIGESGNGPGRGADTPVRQTVTRAGPARACLCVPATSPQRGRGRPRSSLKFQVSPALGAAGSFRGETWNWDSNREVAKDPKVLLVLNPREPLRPSRLGVSELKFQVSAARVRDCGTARPSLPNPLICQGCQTSSPSGTESQLSVRGCALDRSARKP